MVIVSALPNLDESGNGPEPHGSDLISWQLVPVAEPVNDPRRVSPRPLNRQARREETSKRPEQGNPNALNVRVSPLRAAFSSRI